MTTFRRCRCRTAAAVSASFLVAVLATTVSCSIDDDGDVAIVDTGNLPRFDDDDTVAGDDSALEDEDAFDDDEADDADDDDEDDDPDDDADPVVEAMEIVPGGGAIPMGKTKSFGAVARWSDGSTTPMDVDVWSLDDESIATVDAAGNVTGVLNGAATLTATSDDLSATADVLVGPDIFFTVAGGKLAAYDRGTWTLILDYLGVPFAAKPRGIAFWNRYVVAADANIGDLAIVVVDIVNRTATRWPISSAHTGPAIVDGFAYVASGWEELTAVELATGITETYSLPYGCVPVDIVAVDESVFVACSGVDDPKFVEPGRVAVFQPRTETMVEIETTSIIPTALAVGPERKRVYVTCGINMFFPEYSQGIVDTIDVESGTWISKTNIGSPMRFSDLTVTNAGVILAMGSVFYGHYLYAYDTTTDVWTRGLNHPIVIEDFQYYDALAYNPFAEEIWVSDWDADKIHILEADSYKILRFIDAPDAANFAFWDW